MNTRKAYDTDLTDAQWERVKCLFGERPASMVGRPREYSYREIVNAILYLLRTGCQWRNLPHDFPPYTLISYYYHAWRKNGLVQRLHDALRGQVRREEGREAEPSVLIVDSQSSKTTEKGGQRNLKKLSAMTLARTSKDANATLG
jgi:transposase